MKIHLMLYLIVVLSVLTGCDLRSTDIAAVDTQRTINADSEPQNWLAHGRTYDEQRFSPLDDINDSTVNALGWPGIWIWVLTEVWKEHL